MENNNEFGSQILNSIRQQIDSRLASPLIGSFAISWAIVNYKFILILLSDNSVSQKLLLIDKIAFPTIFEFILNSFAIPLVVALLYIFLLPVPEREIFRYTRNRQREIIAIQNEIEGNQLLTREESRALKLKARELEQELGNRINKLVEDVEERDLMISTIKAQLKAAEAGLPSTDIDTEADEETPHPELMKSEKSEAESRIRKEIEPVELAILRILANNRSHRLSDLDRKIPGYSEVRIQVAAGHLFKRALVEVEFDEHGEHMFKLSDLGREEVVSLGLD